MRTSDTEIDNADADPAAVTQLPDDTPAAPLDRDLARIVAAWPELPEPIRRALLALVDASGEPR